ncbi:hypothetical protein [Bacteroides xylanisolvens]|uniref:hypothetical protein n=1 Tax=Bacteroides xylanisolvens TaxID=371601 RepID=UPI0032C11CE8
MAYRYTRLAKSLSFTGVANYQGMSRHMDMRTLRIQSAEALPEAPRSSGLSLKGKRTGTVLLCKFCSVSWFSFNSISLYANFKVVCL